MANRMTPFRFAGWGSEVPTTVMDNALLEQHFGDGAGAVVVTRDADVDSGLLASDLGCEGALTDLVGIRAGGSRQPTTQESVAQRETTLHMQGRPIFEFAVRTLVQSIDATLARASVNLDDVDWFVPHQANL